VSITHKFKGEIAYAIFLVALNLSMELLGRNKSDHKASFAILPLR